MEIENKKFDHREYYKMNKVKINEYNRKYFKSYYINVVREKKYKNEKYSGGCIITPNVRVTF